MLFYTHTSQVTLMLLHQTVQTAACMLGLQQKQTELSGNSNPSEGYSLSSGFIRYLQLGEVTCRSISTARVILTEHLNQSRLHGNVKGNSKCT